MFVNLTLNCTENIFERKDQVIANWNEIVALVEDELKIDYRIDHGIPYCFFMGSKMRVRMRAVHCSMDCAGLIGPDLSLRHCNQTSENLTCIRQGGRFVPYKILDQYLLCEHSRMQHDCLAKLCRDCVLYGEKCNGGFYVQAIDNKGINCRCDRFAIAMKMLRSFAAKSQVWHRSLIHKTMSAVSA